MRSATVVGWLGAAGFAALAGLTAYLGALDGVPLLRAREVLPALRARIAGGGA